MDSYKNIVAKAKGMLRQDSHVMMTFSRNSCDMVNPITEILEVGADWWIRNQTLQNKLLLLLLPFSSRARILGECSTIYSPPARGFVFSIFVFFSGD